MSRRLPSWTPETARLAAQERALIRAQWQAPWARRERAFGAYLWLLWPAGFVLVATLAAWIGAALNLPLLGLGAIVLLLAIGLFSLLQLRRQVAALRRHEASLCAAAAGLGSSKPSAEIEPLLQWLERYWTWGTPSVLYGPRGIVGHCPHVAGQFAGRPVLVVQWSRKSSETVASPSSTWFTDDEAYLPDHRTTSSVTIHEAGWLVLVACPDRADFSATVGQLGPFFVRTVPGGVEATSFVSEPDPSWEELRSILSVAPMIPRTERAEDRAIGSTSSELEGNGEPEMIPIRASDR